MTYFGADTCQVCGFPRSSTVACWCQMEEAGNMLPEIKDQMSFSEAVQAALGFLRDYISKWIGQPVDVEASWKPRRNKAIIEVTPAKGKEGTTTMQSSEKQKAFELMVILRPTLGQEMKGVEEGVVQEKQSVMALNAAAACWKAGLSMAVAILDRALLTAEDQAQKELLEGTKAEVLATRNRRVEVDCEDF